MTELYPTDADLNALSGTVDSEQEIIYPSIYEAPYYTTFYKMLHRLLNVARRAGDLRVFSDGEMTFGVRPGGFFNGDTAINYAGAAEQSLTDNATNYIYIIADGTLTVDTTSFPAQSTQPHIRLAEVATSSGAISSIADHRSLALMSLASNMTPANANTLSDGSTADTLHVHGTDGIEEDAITPAKLSGDITEDKMAAAATQTITGSVEIDHDDKQAVVLTINVTSGTASCTIKDGTVAGQELLLLVDTITANHIQILDSGNAILGGKWYRPGVGYGLVVRWDGTAWHEIRRFANTNNNNGLLSGSAGGSGVNNNGNYSGSAGGYYNNNNSTQSGSAGGSSNNNSGIAAGSAGGYGNSNSGGYSGSVGGYSNNNSGERSGSVGGYYGRANHYAEVAHAAGRFTATGDAQNSKMHFLGSTTDAAQIEIYPSQSSSNRFTIASGAVYTFVATCVAKRTDSQGEVAGFEVKGVIKNISGTTSIQGTNVSTELGGTSGWALDLVADDTNDALAVKVTGEASKTIRWSVKVELVKVAS